MSQQKAQSLIKYNKSSKSTIYCWQLIRLNPSGQGQHSYPAVFREPLRCLEPPPGLPATSAQFAGEGVVGVYYLCAPFKQTQQKNKAPLLLAMLAAPTYGAPWQFLLRNGCPGCVKVLPAAICWCHDFTLSWILTGKQHLRREGRGREWLGEET